VTTDIRSPELTQALAELAQADLGHVEVVSEDGAGVVVRITGVELGDRWSIATGDLWFQIPYHYPDAAIYPYHVTGSVPAAGNTRGLQAVTWRKMPATQVSLRHTCWNPNVDTALGSVRQTIAWLQTR
jgi:hypothetical protein